MKASTSIHLAPQLFPCETELGMNITTYPLVSNTFPQGTKIVVI